MRRYLAAILSCVPILGLLLCLLTGCPKSEMQVQDRPFSNEPPAPAGVKDFSFGRPDVVLMVTGGGNGLMEVCNCAGPMLGGLSRRSGMAISYRAKFPGSVIMIDTGDSFWGPGDNLVNQYMLAGFNVIGYDAMVLGDHEWQLAASRLEGMIKPGKMEFLSSTVTQRPGVDGVAALPVVKAATRQFGDAKIAIVSDLRAEAIANVPKDRQAELTVASDAELTALVDSLKKQGHMVVVICHGDDESIKRTAKVCAADLFIQGHKVKPSGRLSTIEGRPFITAKGSDYVEVLGIQFAPGGKVGKIEYRHERVDDQWPGDDRLLSLYDSYTKSAMQAALASTPKPGLDYASSAQCGSCHKAQYDNWTKTAHSHAFPTLVKAKRTDDPACIGCHTSGFGTTKGFYSIAKTPQLANVNCQNCHKVGYAEHVKSHAMPKAIAETTCRECHTEVTAPGFQYAQKLPIVRCPSDKRPTATMQVARSM